MSTLKQLVDETTLIKNDLVNCRNTLESNLLDKDIEVVPGAKMSTLIDKVGDITLGKKWASGSTQSENYNGGSYRLTVSGLEFRPRLIIFTNPNVDVNVYCDPLDFGVNLAHVESANTVELTTGSSSITRLAQFKEDSTLATSYTHKYIHPDGFSFGLNRAQLRLYNWIAFE